MPRKNKLGIKHKPEKDIISTLKEIRQSDMKKQVQSLIDQVDRLRKHNNSLKKENTSLKTRNNSLKTRNNSLKTRNNSLKTRNNSLMNQLAISKDQNKKKAMKIKIMTKNSKIKDAMNETHDAILQCYEKEQIQKNRKSQSIAQNWKNLFQKNKNKNTVGKRLLANFNKIDTVHRKTKSDKLKREDFEFPFGEEIGEKDLSNFINEIINFINNNYSVEVRRKLKNYFECDKIAKNIKLISDQGIRSTLKKDMIISLLLEENKNELTSLSAPILCNKISEIPLKAIKLKKKGKQITLDKTYLENAVRTKIISNIYQKVCLEYVNGYKFSQDVMINKLCAHIKKMKIFFGELPEDICGLTLYTGDVIINAKYLNLIYLEEKKNDFNKEQAICSIFLTLLHELAHILMRLMNSEINNDTFKNAFNESEDLAPILDPAQILSNYKIQTLPVSFLGRKNKIIAQFNKIIDDYGKIVNKKKHARKKKTGLNESGKFFDYNLFGIESYFDLTKKESNFFLNLKNFNQSEGNYYKNLKNIYNMRTNKSKGYPFKETNSNDYAVSLGICNFSKRNN